MLYPNKTACTKKISYDSKSLFWSVVWISSVGEEAGIMSSKA